MIEGVYVHPLKIIKDDRGQVMHMLRRDDPHFSAFGEIYFSTVKQNIVKGWHLHKMMTLNYAVPFGRILFGLYDEREDSPTYKKTMRLTLDQSNYSLVTVPPGVWNGFKGLSDAPAIVANCADTPHDPEEIVRLDPFKNHIDFNWNR